VLEAYTELSGGSDVDSYRFDIFSTLYETLRELNDFSPKWLIVKKKKGTQRQMAGMSQSV